MIKNCKNCMFSANSRIPQFVICEFYSGKPKQKTDTCDYCTLEGEDEN